MEELSLGVYDEKFQNPLAAADYLESIRWPDGPVCPHCGESERKPYRLKSETRKLWKCAACRKQYTVTVGTIFEGSHIGLHKWLLAFYLLCSSKKGMSAHQLHRMLGVTYKSAWFMAHRIRCAMEQPPFARQLTGTVEADETYVGGKVRRSNVKQYAPLSGTQTDTRPSVKKTGRGTDKTPVMLLVERGGQARSFRMANVTGDSLGSAIRQHVAREAHLRTDSFSSYKKVGREYATHLTVDHNIEYVRGDAHTNTAENYFSILKRGIDGVYHHVSEAHLPRYLAEFDFRYNHRAGMGYTDTDRTVAALRGVVGKRLTYAM
ncbi:MAG TPA: IS1595 family transposase [Gaiellaceae bacterium]|nr:IS1595 family transposase [Gaiellaceae bacterium]